MNGRAPSDQNDSTSPRRSTGPIAVREPHWVNRGAARVLPIPNGEIVVDSYLGRCDVTLRTYDGRPQRVYGHLPLGLAEGLAADLAQRLHATRLIDPDAAWRQLPATERQVSLLRRRGMPTPPGITRGEASEMITVGVGGRR